MTLFLIGFRPRALMRKRRGLAAGALVRNTGSWVWFLRYLPSLNVALADKSLNSHDAVQVLESEAALSTRNYNLSVG